MGTESSTEKWEEFKNAWGDFIRILFSPSVLILILATIGLIIGNQTQENNPFFSKTITFIISIFSGIVGALIAKKWIEINEAGILVTRGKSAIRGLKLLLLNINSLEQRVNVHLNRLIEKDPHSEIAKHNYEEIIEKCNSLEEEALNAVEEWEDIIPEANIKTKIGVISRLKGERGNLEEEIEKLKKQKEESDEVSEELTKELEEKENELVEVKDELKSKEWELDNSILSGMDDSDVRIYSEFTCSDCNNTFSSTELNPRCPECGKTKTVMLDTIL
jgi:rubrerythrin